MQKQSRFAGRRFACFAAFLFICTLLPVFPKTAAEPVDEDAERFFEEIPVSRFYADGLSSAVTDKLLYSDWWYSPWEDCRYLFLPASADRSSLTLHYTAKGALTLNGQAVPNGQPTDLLASADSFAVKLGETDCGTLKIMQSDRACVFLSAASNGLEYLESHADDEEKCPVCILNPDGTAMYQCSDAELSPHGNSTWKSADKKSYNLKLPEKTNLFGMGKAKKWMLISNYFDNSMLRNAAAIEMSRQAGMEYAVDYVYTDLWIDGAYRGTYQFCERIQIQKNRINIRDLEEETEKLNEKDLKEYKRKYVGATAKQYMENSYRYYSIPNNPEDITGGYLLQFQLYNRYPKKAKSGFVTSRGQAVQIDGPKYASKKQVEYIRGFMQDLEDAIYSEDGYNSKGKHYTDYIDADSLALAYLVLEISQNIDGTTTSFYFWKDSDQRGDGKLHCGPVWDFDLAFYNYRVSIYNSEGDTATGGSLGKLLVPCFPISGYDTNLEDSKGSGRPTVGIGWLGQLYKHHPEFAERAAELYFERFDSIAAELGDKAADGRECLIKQWSAELKVSADMNNARWHMLGVNRDFTVRPNNGDTYEKCVEHVCGRIRQRCINLRKIWLPSYKESLKNDLTAAFPADLTLYDSAGKTLLTETLHNAVQTIDKAKASDAAVQAKAAAEQTFLETPRKEITGDFNDDKAVDLRDAQALLQYYARSLLLLEKPVDSTRFRNGDTDGNGVLNAADAIHILRYVNAQMLGETYLFPKQKTE